MLMLCSQQELTERKGTDVAVRGLRTGQTAVRRCVRGWGAPAPLPEAFQKRWLQWQLFALCLSLWPSSRELFLETRKGVRVGGGQER